MNANTEAETKMTAYSLNLRRWRIAVATHDVENPSHTSYGIGLSAYDIERLGLEEGEELWSGIKLEAINVTSGNFRVLCNGEHNELKPRTLAEKEQQETRAVSTERELVPA
jgi:hypothetical protein